MSTVEDVSRILRRKCPSQKDILEGSKHLQDQTDSLWFMEEEEDADGNHDRRDTLDENLAIGRKRRKLSAKISRDNPPQFHGQHLLARAQTAAFLESTTMQNRAAFSCPDGGGFTSAAAQLHCMTEADYTARQTNSCREKTRLPSGRHGASQGGENANLGVILKDKSNLLSLWGTKSSQSHLSSSNANSYQQPKVHCYTGAQMHKDQILSKGESKKYISSIHDQTQVIHTEKPHNCIPQGLANHELISRPHQTRHRPGENDQPPKHYLFLSSSPPPTDDLASQQTSLDRGVGGAFCTEASLKERVTKGEASGGNNRPASTFHTTSMAEVREGAKHSKKTLGIRRSMMGWTCRGNQRFSIPGKARKGI